MIKRILELGEEEKITLRLFHNNAEEYSLLAKVLNVENDSLNASTEVGFLYGFIVKNGKDIKLMITILKSDGDILDYNLSSNDGNCQSYSGSYNISRFAGPKLESIGSGKAKLSFH